MLLLTYGYLHNPVNNQLCHTFVVLILTMISFTRYFEEIHFFPICWYLFYLSAIPSEEVGHLFSFLYLTGMVSSHDGLPLLVYLMGLANLCCWCCIVYRKLCVCSINVRCVQWWWSIEELFKVLYPPVITTLRPQRLVYLPSS